MGLEAIIASLLLLAAEQPADLPECDQEKADQGVQPELNACAYREYLIADRALNDQWRVTAEKMRELDKSLSDYDFPSTPIEYRNTLLVGQRAWLKYRDAQCKLEGDMLIGGTMLPMVVSFCLKRVTENRTQELKRLTEWPS